MVTSPLSRHYNRLCSGYSSGYSCGGVKPLPLGLGQILLARTNFLCVLVHFLFLRRYLGEASPLVVIDNLFFACQCIWKDERRDFDDHFLLVSSNGKEKSGDYLFLLVKICWELVMTKTNPPSGNPGYATEVKQNKIWCLQNSSQTQ